MRVLIDNNLSPRLVSFLGAFGHECSHVHEFGLSRASDESICEYAVANGYLLITADSDFPQMLALSGASKPSVILLVGDYPSSAEQLAILVQNELLRLSQELESGAVVSISPRSTRVRRIPI